MRVEYAHYDLATPYLAARDTINYLKLDDRALDRIEEAFFDTGHMPYVGCREEEADGIATFIRTSQGAPKSIARTSLATRIERAPRPLISGERWCSTADAASPPENDNVTSATGHPVASAIAGEATINA